MFADIIETEETRALQQEINQNCQERYRDLVAGGLGEDDAIHAVVESLNGMEEALKDYPRRQAEQHMSGFDSFACDSGNVKQIAVFTKAGNVQVEPSSDGQIHAPVPGWRGQPEGRSEGRGADHPARYRLGRGYHQRRYPSGWRDFR